MKPQPEVDPRIFWTLGRFRGQRQRPELLHAKSQRLSLWAWDVAESDTETRLPIGVAALPILATESAADCCQHRQAAGVIAPAVKREAEKVLSPSHVGALDLLATQSRSY